MAPPRLSIDIRVEHRDWRKAWPGLTAEARRMLTTVAQRADLSAKARGEVAVMFADDLALQELNARFRGKDKPTNVLSFPDPKVPLGGIALAFETIQREARGQKKDIVHHSKHMILHGFLHLLGYDHETAKEARLMEGLETAILRDMGIPDPYLTRTKTRA